MAGVRGGKRGRLRADEGMAAEREETLAPPQSNPFEIDDEKRRTQNKGNILDILAVAGVWGTSVGFAHIFTTSSSGTRLEGRESSAEGGTQD